ncbi:AAA family ATPase [Cerasicoccus maritimus]|uniref:AAA family ATPase n=1 Tax=Cerasicoccus maritimus TaxID=490089 RepID=UPI002852CCB5|nr:AAA family ATPase [Cerasicoccus maritimus]
MSDKDDGNILEEIQKKLQNMMPPGSKIMGMHPMGSMGAAPDEEEPQGEIDQEAEDAETLRRIRDFNLKPKDIRDHLNRYVIKQFDAKKVLSVAICDHYNHIRQCLENERLLQQDYAKQNILLLGPTGVGKTYLMRNIARYIGVPFVKADATKFSETGYVGSDVEDLVRDLVKAANGNVELAQYGIIYIDEIDKIASSGNMAGGKDVSGRGVQINLLKLMEDTEVNLFSPNDLMGQMQAMMTGGQRGKKPNKRTINTRHILFIVSGAFDKLGETIQKRVDQSSIGFGASRSDSAREDPFQYLKKAATRDFIDYGFEPEFIGRIPVRVACESLQPDDLAAILTSSEGSLLKQYRRDFQGYEIDFKITPEAIIEIASQAFEEKTGARGLMTVLERIFRNYKFELPSTAIKSFEVTTDMIANPEDALTKLIVDHKHLMRGVWEEELDAFTKAFESENSFKLTFTDEAADHLIEAATEADRTLRTICDERFKDFPHGLNIVARNTGQTTFEINLAAAENPDKELSQWVVQSFKHVEESTPAPEADEPVIDAEESKD